MLQNAIIATAAKIRLSPNRWSLVTLSLRNLSIRSFKSDLAYKTIGELPHTISLLVVSPAEVSPHWHKVLSQWELSSEEDAWTPLYMDAAIRLH